MTNSFKISAEQPTSYTGCTVYIIYISGCRNFNLFHTTFQLNLNTRIVKKKIKSKIMAKLSFIKIINKYW